MTPALLTLALALADPIGFPAPPAVTAAAAPAPARPAPPPATPPAATPAAPVLTLPASAGPGLDSLILPVAALLALAVAALVATRRKRQAPHLVQVLETTSLGPKRSLVVARVGDEIMVIGASEAGLHLLSARPAGPDARVTEPAARLVAVPDPAPEGATAGHKVLGLLARLGRRQAAGKALRPAAGADLPGAVPGAFEALLAESDEDQELRRKLSRGQSGSVR